MSMTLICPSMMPNIMEFHYALVLSCSQTQPNILSFPQLQS